jgi:hypothetical protein
MGRRSPELDDGGYSSTVRESRSAADECLVGRNEFIGADHLRRGDENGRGALIDMTLAYSDGTEDESVVTSNERGLVCR